MNKITSITLVTSILLVFFVLGIGFGGFYQMKKINSQQKMFDKYSDVIKVLNSELIGSVTLYGTITDIKGKNVTLDSGSSNVTISMMDNIPVTSVTSVISKNSKNPVITQTKAEFKDIQKGQSVSVAASVLENGKIGGKSVVAFTYKEE